MVFTPVLSPLLVTLPTHDCTPPSSSKPVIKFAGDTTVVGLTNANETMEGSEVSLLATWCYYNDLHLNVEETKEIVVHSRRECAQHPLLTINGAAGAGEQHQVPWCPHLPRPVLDHHHCITGLKSQSATLLPTQTKRSTSPAPIRSSFCRGSLRAPWPAASLCGSAPASLPAGRPCSTR